MASPRQSTSSGQPSGWTPKPPPPTLEQAGIFPGSRFLESEEEAAERERLETERTERDIAHLDSVLHSMWACACCGAQAGPGQLCAPCAAVVRQLRMERARAETVNGRTRAELAEAYLSREAEREAAS